MAPYASVDRNVVKYRTPHVTKTRYMQSATSTDGKARAVMFDAYAAKHESSLCMGFIASKNQLCYLRQIASASVPRNGQPLETLNCERRNDVAERAALLQACRRVLEQHGDAFGLAIA